MCEDFLSRYAELRRPANSQFTAGIIDFKFNNERSGGFVSDRGNIADQALY